MFLSRRQHIRTILHKYTTKTVIKVLCENIKHIQNLATHILGLRYDTLDWQSKVDEVSKLVTFHLYSRGATTKSYNYLCMFNPDEKMDVRCKG